MNKLVVAVCLAASGIATQAVADEKDYVARLNDGGEKGEGGEKKGKNGREHSKT